MRKILLLFIVFTLSLACMADEITVAGNTAGTLSAGPDAFVCGDGLCASNGNESGVVFTPSSFSVTTSGGSSLLALGTISTFLGLESSPAADYTGSQLTLTLYLNSPAGGPATLTYVAMLSGSIGGEYEADKVMLHFVDPNSTVSFAGGSYLLHLNDLTLASSDQQDIMATISDVQTVNAVPEPASLLLIGTGLCGVGVFRRQRG